MPCKKSDARISVSLLTSPSQPKAMLEFRSLNWLPSLSGVKNIHMMVAVYAAAPITLTLQQHSVRRKMSRETDKPLAEVS